MSDPQPTRRSGGASWAPAAIAFSANFRQQKLRIAWKIANSTLKKWWWQSPPLLKVVLTSHHRHIQSCAYALLCGKKRTKHANNSVERGNKTLETTLQPTFRVKLIAIFTQQRRVKSISGVRHSVFQADQSRRGDVTSSCRERRRYQ